jgi:hypothetical protein
MSKVLENRKSSFALATKKEIELTYLLSLTYVRARQSVFHLYSITYINAAMLVMMDQNRMSTTGNH